MEHTKLSETLLLEIVEDTKKNIIERQDKYEEVKNYHNFTQNYRNKYCHNKNNSQSIQFEWKQLGRIFVFYTLIFLSSS